MDKNLENVKQAKESFEHVLGKNKYTNIIKDDKHLSVILNMLDGDYGKILDIGTGTGYLAFPLSEKFPQATVVGLDIVEKIMLQNTKVVEEKGISNLLFQAFDGLNYPFPQKSFDLIVTRYAFHHFPNVVHFIQQMKELLAEGGKVFISDPVRNPKDKDGIIDEFMRIKKDGHIQFYALDDLEELFVKNGFVKEKQVITNMKFPFVAKQEYIEMYDRAADRDRALYDMKNESGVIWVQHIDVGNTVFTKK